MQILNRFPSNLSGQYFFKGVKYFVPVDSAGMYPTTLKTGPHKAPLMKELDKRTVHGGEFS